MLNYVKNLKMAMLYNRLGAYPSQNITNNYHAGAHTIKPYENGQK